MDLEPVDSRCDTVRMSKAEIDAILAQHAEDSRSEAHDRDTLPAPPPVTGE